MEKKKILTILSELCLLICTVVCWLPVYYFVISAFKLRKDIVKYPLHIIWERFTVDNFSYVWKNMKLAQSLFNTSFITIVTLILLIGVSSMAGFALSRIKGKFFQVYYRANVALMVVPFISCLLSLVILSTKLNLYNTVWGCIFIHTAWHLPFCAFLYAGFMGSLPVELEEAAYIDGCSTFQVYFQIFLPLLAPITATCCIRSGITIWNDFLLSSTLLNSARKPTLMVGINSFFGEYVSEYGYAFAGIILASLPISILFIFLRKYFIKGLTAGAVKG
ncbi:MAG: carbohydrate ABC transporter permease [Hungatella sp.]|jgi:raffinose/stachyose/melibiose transport system permease protein|nr:carbohydrate ABC transporter permease [Hungatella sp.]